jgi:hypothetical protein
MARSLCAGGAVCQGLCRLLVSLKARSFSLWRPVWLAFPPHLFLSGEDTISLDTPREGTLYMGKTYITWIKMPLTL